MISKVEKEVASHDFGRSVPAYRIVGNVYDPEDEKRLMDEAEKIVNGKDDEWNEYNSSVAYGLELNSQTGSI